MKRIALLAMVGSILSGCSHLVNFQGPQNHTIEAAIIGSVAGGLIGGLATGNASGVGLGAGIGAAAGAAIATVTH